MIKWTAADGVGGFQANCKNTHNIASRNYGTHGDSYGDQEDREILGEWVPLA